MLFFLLFANKIYLDYAATTPCDPQVSWAMDQIYRRKLGNPLSSHSKGREAQLEITKAEETLKSCTKGKHVVWTSGATESNNLAILGPDLKGVTITCVTEHSSVVAPVEHLKNKLKQDVIFLNVNSCGHINMTELKKFIEERPRLVSLMFINNETGVIHPIKEIGALCRQYGVLFHVDASAAFGKIDIDMEKLGIDLLTVSAHKFYGPQGIGALILSEAGRKAFTNPLLFGGGDSLRPGTLPTVLCVGLGKAAELACKNRGKEFKDVKQQKAKFLKELKNRFPKIIETGNKDWPYILNVRIPKDGKQNLALILAKDYVFSAGSACSTGKPSHVLTAMAVDLKNNNVFRFSFGH